MVATQKVRRRTRLLALLCSLVGVWACFSATPLHSLADEPEEAPLAVCPVGALVPGEEQVEPSLEIRSLRNDLRETCTAVSDRLDVMDKRLVGLPDRLKELREAVELVTKALEVPGGLKVYIEGQKDGLALEDTAVEVTNPPDVEAVRQAVVQGTETGNQNMWAYMGLLCGAVGLFMVWRMVKP